MARQAKNLQGFKLARYAYEKLQALRVPPRFQENVDLGSVTIRSKPFHDSEVSQPRRRTLSRSGGNWLGVLGWASPIPGAAPCRALVEIGWGFWVGHLPTQALHPVAFWWKLVVGFGLGVSQPRLCTLSRSGGDWTWVLGWASPIWVADVNRNRRQSVQALHPVVLKHSRGDWLWGLGWASAIRMTAVNRIHHGLGRFVLS